MPSKLKYSGFQNSTRYKRALNVIKLRVICHFDEGEISFVAHIM